MKGVVSMCCLFYFQIILTSEEYHLSSAGKVTKMGTKPIRANMG